MTVRQGQQVALAEGDEVTDAMRARFAEIVKEDPYTGIAAAALRAGIPGTRRQQKQLVAQDPELQLVIADARRGYLKDHGIGVERLITKLATVVENDESSSQLRAITLGLTLNGVHTDVQRVEHTGADGGPVEVNTDVGAALDRFTASIRRLSERGGDEPGGAVRPAHSGRPELAAGDAGD